METILNKESRATIELMVADGIIAKDTAERYFPELKESEDERIRKGLLYVIKHHPSLPAEEAEEYIAWLEKQGENSVCKVKIGETYKCIASPRYTCFRMGDIYHVKDNFVAELINMCSGCFVLLEKQSEQKSEEVYNLHNYLYGKQSPVWSKEDKDYYDAIITKLEVTQEDATLTDNQMNFLKSLKERYTWKPSDEQIEAVRLAAEIGTANNSWAMGILKSMYQDLKKLREE